MSTKLRSINRTLLVDELKSLLDDLKAYRSGKVAENAGATRSAELAKRVDAYSDAFRTAIRF
jgi:hypothetical protein